MNLGTASAREFRCYGGLLPCIVLMFSAACHGSDFIFPVSYDVQNGNTGAFTYQDDSYAGQGDRTVDGAYLTGGLGQLSDGIVSSLWSWSSQADAAPWIGWQYTDPDVRFVFDEEKFVDTINLHTLANRQAGIDVWDSVAVSLDGGAPTLFPLNASAFTDNSLHSVALPINARATTVRLSLVSDWEWGFLSEVEFVGRPSGPRVAGFAVDGLTWTPTAHAVPLGSSAQSAPLPFTRINQVTLTFDEHVTITAGQVTLTDQSGNDYALFGPFTGQGSEPGSFVATWQTESFLDIGRYTLKLEDGIVDDDGNSLDGEWTNDVSTASGDGQPGGDFSFTFNVLPGDANQDGLVSIVDAIEVRNLVGKTLADPAYSALHDIDARGSVELADVYATLTRAFDVLPPQPASSAAAVPEPTGVAAMLGAIAVFCVARRRRVKSS
jgi:hypothetical protein